MGISLRSYQSYETDVAKQHGIKYDSILRIMKDKSRVDETHGILTLDQIKRGVGEVLSDYHAHFCWLFGSYAKGEANECSDVDLIVSADIGGMQVYGLAEKLRSALHKEVDLLMVNQLADNPQLLYNVLKEGIKIYEGR